MHDPLVIASRRRRRLAIGLALAIGMIGSSGSRAAEKPPAAVPGDLVTDYHGIRVADPYRSLEAVDAPQTRDWATAQAAWTRSQLDRLPGLASLRDRITALDAEQPPVISALKVIRGGRWFYLKRNPGEPVPKLYWRASERGPERVLLDPVQWAGTTVDHFAIDNFTVAPDGRHVAAVVSRNDAELGELRIYEVATRQQVGPAVPAIWGELPAMWSVDSRRVFFARGLDALKPDGAPFGKMQIFEHAVAGGADRPVLGWNAGFGPAVDEKDWVQLDASSAPGWTLVTATKGVAANTRVSFARTRALERDPSTTPWIDLFGDAAGVRATAVVGRWVYAKTFVGAPRYRIVRYDLTKLQAPPEPVVPQQDGVIEDLTAAADGLYYTVRRASVARVFRVPYAGEPVPVPIALPFEGAASLFDAEPLVPGVTIALEGWTEPRVILRTRAAAALGTDLLPRDATAPGQDWVAEETTCTSHDGVEVPMSIVYRRGIPKDGSHPTLMDGYGGYGLPELASFLRRLDPWFQRGGVFVEVAPRGGGAYGRDWYQAGVGARKANTWKDMIACAVALIDRGYTARGKLAIQGTSMGGVAVGRSITERPDLFAAAVVRVGITDAIRFIEATDNGPNHEDEMGSLATAAGVEQLLAMSTYAQIGDGTAYPATLFTAGLNDHRVAPWLTFKTFARLSAATSSGKPVLLRIDEAGGHGMTTTTQQRNAELADRLAFVLWNTGDPDFQPAP